ncbi:MAG: glycosyltransferase [Treponemataceae bacterium]|nr:glycosyltransferase [Treponemataceae bacterium]
MGDLIQFCIFVYLASLGFLRLHRFYTAPFTILLRDTARCFAGDFHGNLKDSFPLSSPDVPLSEAGTLQRGSESSLSFSVIVPARNEEHRLPGLLQSLANQLIGPFEIIVVDDGSVDGTAEVARQFGCRVLQHKESSWIGKSAACFLGAQAASGEILVFFDADVTLAPDALAYLLRYYQKGTALSVQPYHFTEKIYEQGSLYFNLVTILGLDLGRWRHPFTTKRGFFGPCLVIDRETYLASGGHGLVRDSILEDMVLGQAFAKLKIPLYSLPHKGRIRFRMYAEGFRKLFDGWSKNMALGAQRSSFWTILIVSSIMALSFSVPIGVIRSFAESNIKMGLLYGVTYFGFASALYFSARRIGSFRFLSCLCFPVLALLFVVVLVRSFLMQVLRLPLNWRGRKVEIK